MLDLQNQWELKSRDNTQKQKTPLEFFVFVWYDSYMILSDTKIRQLIEAGDIIIKPYDDSCLGCNSYDVHLSPHLRVYTSDILDARAHNQTRDITIGDEGFVLQPGVLYLGSTIEYTESHKHVPFIEGKSSTGRLGISIHATAGRGDVGFCGHWTLEITVPQPVRVYAGMPIAQLIYYVVDGEVAVPYNKKQSAKYSDQGEKPVESMMWKNEF